MRVYLILMSSGSQGEGGGYGVPSSPAPPGGGGGSHNGESPGGGGSHRHPNFLREDSVEGTLSSPISPKIGSHGGSVVNGGTNGDRGAGTDTDTEIKKKVGTKKCQLVIVST